MTPLCATSGASGGRPSLTLLVDGEKGEGQGRYAPPLPLLGGGRLSSNGEATHSVV